MSTILANGGSALLWFEAMHLTLGNVAIALGEAIVLRVAFRVPLGRGIGWMLVANFASLIAVSLTVGISGGLWYRLSPLAAFWAILASAVSFWVATVLIEWPVIARAMRPLVWPWKRALWASLLVQTLSYAALVPLYLDAGPTEVLLRPTIVEAEEFAPDTVTDAHVYYLDPDGAAVWRVALDGTGRTRIAAVTDAICQTGLQATEDGTALLDFGAGVSLRLDSGRIVPCRTDERDPTSSANEAAGPWRLSWGPEVGYRLTAENAESGERMRLDMQTPFLSWHSRDVTPLPGSLLVYALGPHIIVLDLQMKRLAVLAEGSRPIVVLAAD